MTRSWRNQVESKDVPILTRGGPSSSHVLNEINKNIQSDITRLNAKVQELDRQHRLLAVYLEQQAVGINSLVNNLQTLVPAAPGDRGIADFFSSDYVHAENTSKIDEDYGQATLPILSVQEKLHTVDTQGNIWIPDDSRLMFLSQSSFTGNIPNDDLFFSSVEDYNGIGDQPDTFFLGGELSSTSYVFLKAVLPQSLNTHKLSNRITFHPIPAFSHQLVGAYFKKTDGSWNAIDIDYLPGYTTSTTPVGVSYLGPTRIHFSPNEVTQVCIVLKAIGWWGIQQFGVQLVEYNTSSKLVVDMSSYNLPGINSVVLNGKNSSILNRYSYEVVGNKVSINLSQSESLSTPVITGVDVRY